MNVSLNETQSMTTMIPGDYCSLNEMLGLLQQYIPGGLKTRKVFDLGFFFATSFGSR